MGWRSPPAPSEATAWPDRTVAGVLIAGGTLFDAVRGEVMHDALLRIEDGVITGEGSSTTWPQVRDLMSQAVADSADARAAAGRTGPGTLGGGEVSERGEHDNLPRMDRELLDSGIHPGHPSLYESPDAGPGEVHDHPHEQHTHAHQHGH